MFRKKISILLSLILGLSCSGFYEETFAASTSKKEGASGGGGGSAGHAGEIEIRRAPNERKLWANHFDFHMHGIHLDDKEITEKVINEANLIREFYDTYPSDISTHIANVVILYKISGTPRTFKYNIPQYFFSGNFSRTIYLTEKRAVPTANAERWPLHFKEKILLQEFFSVGDCYDGLESLFPLIVKGDGETEGQFEIRNSKHLEEMRKLRRDFRIRGVRIGDSDTINPQSHSHSEQAFLSCVLQQKVTIPDHNPISVTILINGHQEPCTHCTAALNHLLNDASFKTEFIHRLFPGFSGDISKLPLNVLYSISDKIPISIGLDLSENKSYFIQARQ